MAQALLTPARCQASLEARRACAHAAEAALRRGDPRLRLVPAGLRPAPGEVLVRDFGAARVVRLPEPAARGDEGADEEAAYARLDAWDALPPGAVPFPALAAWIGETSGFVAGAEAPAHAALEAATTAAAVEAFLRTSQDPFARLVPRAQDDRQLHSAGATRVGVGLSLLGLPGVLLVERVAAGGPAARVGVRPGDVLVAIDGWELAGLGTRDAARLLQGSEGSPVRLRLLRDGQTTEHVATRARIEVPHAFGRLLRGPSGARVGYLRLASLHSERACPRAASSTRALLRANPRGLVLDLRGNPGGLVEQARCVADLFLPPGRRVATLVRRGPAGTEEAYDTRGPALTALPLVALVDAGTMSAAELLAAALRAHDRALIAGQRTYGKGSVQDAFPWVDGLPVTVYRTVGGYEVGPQRWDLQAVGLPPDVTVDRLGRLGSETRARRAAWRYLEAWRRPPPPRRPAAGPRHGACADQVRPEAWLSTDGEAVGPQLRWAASATRCAPALAPGSRPEPEPPPR